MSDNTIICALRQTLEETEMRLYGRWHRGKRPGNSAYKPPRTRNLTLPSGVRVGDASKDELTEAAERLKDAAKLLEWARALPTTAKEK